MLYYDRIQVSEGIDVDKTSPSKECIVCHKRFKFQPDDCNGCHNVLMMSMNLKDIAILNICVVNYCCISYRISKSEAVKLLQDAVKC